MKSLSTDAAASALGVSRKTLDNILAREGRVLLGPGRRGARRRIPVTVLEHVAVALILNRDFAASIAKALEIAGKILASPATSVPVGTLSLLEFDIPRLRNALSVSIEDALESVAEPTRGRPKSPAVRHPPSAI